MRARCETDLARQFPLAVAAKWLGNTQAVAMRHYVDVTDADFERASAGVDPSTEKAAKNPAQSAHETRGNEPQGEPAAQEKTLVFSGNSEIAEVPENQGVEAGGHQ